ncbi:MAG: carbon-nitrogen hydrolase family protein [Alphaproteobacteria bacterium]|nr:carbon-nitrogen hydrolase family protein [Alphaproteobacteria bacterium SS10]
MSTLHTACLQLTTGPDLTDNIQDSSALIDQSADVLPDGDRLIATPEMTSGLLKGRDRQIERALPMDDHPMIGALAEKARAHQSWVLIGSVAIKLEDEKRLANRSVLLNPAGEIAVTYDKQHMFDVEVEDGQTYRESSTYRPGDRTALADIGTAKLGLTICYDVRFPALYRYLAQAGATVLAVPSAFTVPTGQAHWSTLLRARAIENGAFVIAPAQTGEHEGGRQTYGHSMIIDPWGAVLAEADDQPGFITASLDLEAVTKARRTIPSLQHDRPIG